MAKSKKKKSAKQSAKQAMAPVTQPVIVTSCNPNPNPVKVSKSGIPAPNQIFFNTPDRDRVYEVKIKSGIFGKGKIREPFWYGHDTRVLTVDPDAKKETFVYEIKAVEGGACALPNDDPPTIIVED